MNSLSIITRYSRVYAERKMHEYGIGFPEQIVLMYLSEHEDVNQDAIANFFMIDKGAIAKTLSKLEEKKLIKRHINPQNKRENIISLSPEGMKIINVMKQALEEWNNCIFKNLNEEDIKNFERIVKVIVENVLQLCK